MDQLLLLDLYQLTHLSIRDIEGLLSALACWRVRGEEVASGELLRSLLSLHGVKTALLQAIGFSLQQESLFGVIAVLEGLQLHGVRAQLLGFAFIISLGFMSSF